ncbi:MAG: hypothetical protein DRI01_04280 [Chloroflexi bacterium]|nr:MAG: hypothetical protein DRI01_04280 [Chloroflexota bacterium]
MREGFTQKRCPKCGGNIFLDRDLYGWYEQCLQCSYTSNLSVIVDVREKNDVSSLVQAGGNKTTK